MKLWTVIGYFAEFSDGEKTPACYAVITKDDNPLVIASCGSEKEAQEIADDHNAWLILMQRGFRLAKRANGKWAIDVPTRIPFDGGSTVIENDTPQAAILAADAWLRGRGQ